MMATKIQLAIIANSVATDSSGESRWAKRELAMRLFPESVADINAAIDDHPIEKNWDDYRTADAEARKAFLLPES